MKKISAENIKKEGFKIIEHIDNCIVSKPIILDNILDDTISNIVFDEIEYNYKEQIIESVDGEKTYSIIWKDIPVSEINNKYKKYIHCSLNDVVEFFDNYFDEFRFL